MRLKEQRLWDRFKSALLKGGHWVERIENVAGVGTPDVHGAADWWVELNATSKIPSRPDTPLLGKKDGLSGDQIAWHTSFTKGILCVEDARRAAEMGADGIVLSNHGGRQIDSCVSGVELLPAVSAEVGGRLVILVDGGFLRGSEVLKAIALGAHGVMIGRAALYGLAAGGQRACRTHSAS